MLSLQFEIGLFSLGWLFSIVGVGTSSSMAVELAFLLYGCGAIVRGVKVALYPERFWALCNITAAAGLFSYFMGGFGTLVQYSSASTDLTELVGTNFPERAFLGATYLVVFYWGLAAASVFETKFWRPIFDQLFLEHAGGTAKTTAIELFLWFTAGAQSILMLTGGWTYSGFANSIDPTNSRIPVFTSLIWALAEGVPAVAGWITGRWPARSRIFLLAAAAGLCQFVWFGALGRRVVIYGLLSYLVAFFWARGRHLKLRSLVYLLPLVGLAYFVTKLFLAMRYASYDFVVGNQSFFPTLGSLFFGDALNLVVNQTDLVTSIELENYSSRFFIFGYVATVVNLLTPAGVEYGMFLVRGVMTIIPSMIWPDKINVLQNLGLDEDVLDPALGVPTQDEPWSVFVAGYGDFMWLGAIVYPIVFCGIGILYSWIIRRLRDPLFIVAGIGICYMDFVSTETTIGTLLLTGRTLLLLLAIALLFSYFERGAVQLKRSDDEALT